MKKYTRILGTTMFNTSFDMHTEYRSKIEKGTRAYDSNIDGWNRVSGVVNVLCLLATTVAYARWKLLIIR